MRQFQQMLVRLLFAACVCLCFAWPQTAGAEAPKLRIGVAKVDITPKDLTDITGIGPRPYSGVHDRLYARALVLDNGKLIAAMVTLDLVEMGNTMPLRERIARELSIPADHIIINASHDHSAPRAGPITPGTSSAEGRPFSPPVFIKQVDDSIVDVLKQAKAALQPARMGFGTGIVDVSTARYGYSPARGWRDSPNEDIPTDKTVSVVKFDTPAGVPIAIMFNYAVHSNAMSGEPSNMINGDLAGNAEKFVEHQYGDKVIALWSMSAAADVYPKFNWNMGRLDEASSPFYAVEIQGGMLGGEVVKVAKRITNMTETADMWASERAVPCEMNTAPNNNTPPGGGNGGQNGGANGGQNGGGNGAPGGAGQNAAAGGSPRQPQAPPKQLLPPPKPGDKLNIYMGLIRINQLAITGVSGEVGSEILQHLKRESPFPETLMITLSNDRDGYIPDDAGWDHQGNGQAFVRGCAEKVIVDNLVEMMKATLQ